MEDGRGGAVTVIQRFGGSLNLNIHFHALVLDGVHVEQAAGPLRFHALPDPSGRELLELTGVIARRVQRLLERVGRAASKNKRWDHRRWRWR